MDTNYTPDEIRLLDEFAKASIQGLLAQPDDGSEYVDADGEKIEDFPGICAHMCRTAWSYAAAMIAERRKRVPEQSRRLYSEVRKEFGLDDCTDPDCDEPVAQPEPEKGELTEEAVRQWAALARDEAGRIDGGFWVDDDEIDRAVALMREGLRYRQTAEVLRHKVADLQRTVEQGADDLRAADESITMANRERDEARAIVAMHEQCISDYKLMARNAHCSAYYAEKMREMAPGMCAEMDSLRARAEKAEKERDEAAGWAVEQADEYRARAEKAEAELAAVQPVLDAVPQAYPSPQSYWTQSFNRTLQAYADRRREQAKGAS